MSKHSAPPVTYPVRPSIIQSLVLLGLSIAGLLSSFQWIYSLKLFDWRAALSLSAVVVSALLLLKYDRRPSGGNLAWDGLDWRWNGDGADWTADAKVQSIEVVFDFQQLLVLNTADDGGSQRWAIAHRNGFPERWFDFRRAIYCVQRASLTPALVDTTDSVDAERVAVSSHDQDKNATRIAA